jgi:type VI secretion system Hcp family effector
LAVAGFLLGVGCGGEPPASDPVGPTAVGENPLEAAGRVDFFVKVVDSAGGTFPGESLSVGRTNWIPAIRFYQNVSKTATGSTKCSSISFTKAAGRSSPRFLKAVSSGETLSNVTIEFVATSPTGQPFVSERIELTGIRVSKDEEAVAPPELNVSSALLEQVTLEPNPTATETITSFTTSANGSPGAPVVASFTCAH